jgi:integrase
MAKLNSRKPLGGKKHNASISIPSERVSLNLPLALPVKVIQVDSLPKLLAGGVPVTPLNLVLARKISEGATRQSIDTYLRAASLFVEFCAHRGRALIEITNEEFRYFVDALQGHAFPDAGGELVRLRGKRGKRTADLMLMLLYSIASNIKEIYRVNPDWHRYKGVPALLVETACFQGRDRRRAYSNLFHREHVIKHTERKVVGLPDDQFTLMLRGAYDKWNKFITDGDIAYSSDSEERRGALFFRNVAMLLVLRYSGGRSSEVIKVRFEDIDCTNALLYLSTKGHNGNRLPVVLYPFVHDAIQLYVKSYRPRLPDGRAITHSYVFLSHSTRNYGQPLTSQSVRAMIDGLRPYLDAPWSEQVTPHTLRHSYAYDLQKHAGPGATVTGMRHSSANSLDNYRADIEAFADQLLGPLDTAIEEMFAKAGLLEVINQCNGGKEKKGKE